MRGKYMQLPLNGAHLPSSVIIGISLPDMMLLVTFTGVPIGSKPGGTRPESRNKEHSKNMRRSWVRETLALFWNLGKFVYPTLPVFFRKKHREPLFPYIWCLWRGKKISHMSWTPHSREGWLWNKPFLCLIALKVSVWSIYLVSKTPRLPCMPSAESASSPTVSSNVMALMLSEQRIDSLSTRLLSSFVPLRADSMTHMEHVLMLTALKLARFSGEPCKD